MKRKYLFSTTPLSPLLFDAPSPANPANIRIKLILLETRMPELHFAADDLGLIAVLSGGCEPPVLGKGRPSGVKDGTIRKSVGEFLSAVHSNFSST